MCSVVKYSSKQQSGGYTAHSLAVSRPGQSSGHSPTATVKVISARTLPGTVSSFVRFVRSLSLTDLERSSKSKFEVRKPRESVCPSLSWQWRCNLKQQRPTDRRTDGRTDTNNKNTTTTTTTRAVELTIQTMRTGRATGRAGTWDGPVERCGLLT